MTSPFTKYDAYRYLQQEFSTNIDVEENDTLGIKHGGNTIFYSPYADRIQALVNGEDYWSEEDETRVKALLSQLAQMALYDVHKIRQKVTLECVGMAATDAVGYSGPGDATVYSPEKVAMNSSYYITAGLAQANILHRAPNRKSIFRELNDIEVQRFYNQDSQSFLYTDLQCLLAYGIVTEMQDRRSLGAEDYVSLAMIRAHLLNQRRNIKHIEADDIIESAAQVTGILFREYLDIEPKNASELPSENADLSVLSIQSLTEQTDNFPTDWYDIQRYLPRDDPISNAIY